MAGPWTETAIALAGCRGPCELTAEHLESLAQCALGGLRGTDRLRHLEHVAASDVPLLVREIVRLWDLPVQIDPPQSLTWTRTLEREREVVRVRLDGRREMAEAAVSHLIERRTLSGAEIAEIRTTLLNRVVSLGFS